MNKHTCKGCDKEFKWELVGPIFPGGKEKESLICPYCGHDEPYTMTSQFLQTYKK